MAEGYETIEITRPPDEVWAVLADFGGIVDWAPNVDHSSLTTAQSNGIGAVRRVQVGRNVLLERIVEWNPGVGLAYELEGLPPVVRSATNRWTLSSSGLGSGGTTTATLTSSIDAGPRPPQKGVARIIARALTKASREMLGGLKVHVESQS